MAKELAKVYDPKEVEDRLYKFWTDNKYFAAKCDKDLKPYTIVMPPPNITGQLHMGHALDNTLQDTIIRWRRMQGYDALWLPGTDHASIATEAKIVEAMAKEGIKKEDLGREKFLERAWEWKNQYGGRIVQQLKKMGSSCDWDRLRFTMDEGCSRAVKEVFVTLYEKKLIYRGNRMVNWCPKCKTSISDAEVEYEELPSNFWHLLYTVKETGEKLELATTRPETMLGDTAVAINGDDPRYAHLHGCHVILPLLNKEIPIVCDEHADMAKGTGVVKITPAHDPNDFEVGRRHGLEVITVMTEDAHITEDYPKYAGMDRFEARKEIVKDLEEGGFLIKVEDYNHNVGTCYRCGTTIEPRVSLQWFVKMEELAKPAIEAVKTGKTRFVPQRFEKNYFNWMNDIRDWCISRQLWWGHRIPIWYKNEEVYCGMEAPQEEGWVQDEDVLDTWFSSALWPFSTLGWPDNTEDLGRYFPTDVIVPGFDIIFFWAARMIFQSLNINNQIPFKDCIIHGLIRDEKGRKMSKSLGNGIDPIEMIDKYGADALRYYLTTSSTLGMDLNFNEEKLSSTWNFINKIWNASRFVIMKLDGFTKENFTLDNLNQEDKWILSKLNKTIKNVTKSMDKYDFTNAGSELYNFIWSIFCDDYIEISKTSNSDNTKSVLYYVLNSILKMLHPFMPFVTEEIYQMLPVKDKESIMIDKYPIYDKKHIYNKEEQTIDKVLEDITNIRNLKATNDITKEAKIKVTVDKELETIYKQALKITEDKIIKQDNNNEKYNYKSKYIDITYYQQGKQIDKKQIEDDIEKIKQSIEKRKKLLSNENYTTKAPANIVELDRQKLKEEEEKLKILEAQLT